MEFDNTLARIKDLIAKREAIDAELQTLLGGAASPKRKPQSCSLCQSSEHTARTCPNKPPQE